MSGRALTRRGRVAARALPVSWSHAGRHRDVPAAQRRVVWHGRVHRHDVWIGGVDVSRHLHQHGHAAFQDACGRHGQRETKGKSLFHTELLVQRGVVGGLCLPVFVRLFRHRQHRSQRRGARFGDL